MSDWPGKEDIIKRIVETPAAQDILRQLRDADENGWGPEEIVARIYLVLEDNVNWGVDCQSCASLLNKLYAAESELSQLKNPQFVDGVCTKCNQSEVSHFGYCYLDF